MIKLRSSIFEGALCCGPTPPEQSFLITLTCAFLNAVSDSFVLYCICNTLTPRGTKKLAINAAWFGLEVYTVAELYVKRNFNQVKTSIKAKYPWLSKDYWKDEDDSHSMSVIEFINEQGNTISDEDECDMKSIKMGIREDKAGGTPLLRVMDADIETPHAIKRVLSESKLTIDEHVLDYRLMACTVSDDNGNNWEIKLNNGDYYSYYALGNVILTKTFLKMYARRHLNASDAEKLISILDTEDYTVRVIDNKVNQLSWKGSTKAIELHLSGPILINICQSPVVPENDIKNDGSDDRNGTCNNGDNNDNGEAADAPVESKDKTI